MNCKLTCKLHNYFLYCRGAKTTMWQKMAWPKIGSVHFSHLKHLETTTGSLESSHARPGHKKFASYKLPTWATGHEEIPMESHSLKFELSILVPGVLC